ncbi:hypothetical protein [Thermoleptolyngbya sp.]
MGILEVTGIPRVGGGSSTKRAIAHPPAARNGFVGLNATLSQDHANSAILDLEAGTDYHTFHQAACSADGWLNWATLRHPSATSGASLGKRHELSRDGLFCGCVRPKCGSYWSPGVWSFG